MLLKIELFAGYSSFSHVTKYRIVCRLLECFTITDVTSAATDGFVTRTTHITTTVARSV